jgi:radical SAM protein with 4Fe4S-binding SPASM domain
VNSAFREEEKFISEKTVLPPVPELIIDQRKGDLLILNPLGPWWFIGSKLHADFLEPCDGKRSVRDIFELLLPYYKEIKIEELIQFVNTLFQLKFFTESENQPIHPFSVVHFYITRRCNLKCPFCFFDSTPCTNKKREEELEAGVWIKLAGEIAEINPNATISVSGGEPSMRTDAIDIIEGISRNKLQVRLITNGTIFTDELIKRLAKIPKLKVQVSIDSLIPGENAQTRGQGSLKKAIKAVLRMINAGINVGVTPTVTQINKKSIWRLKRFCKQHNISFGTSFFFKSGERSQNNAGWLELRPNEIIESSLFDSSSFKEKEFDNITLIPGKRRHHCGIGCGQISIHPGGSVSPCRLLLDPKFYLGNVMKSGLHQFLEIGRRKYDFVGVDKLTCGCAACPVRYICVGGCKAISFYTYGLLDRLPPNCGLLKKIYIESLWTSILGPSPHSLENLLFSHSDTTKVEIAIQSK